MILGIDYGTKRIGIALSDETQTLAFPYKVVSAGKESVARIAAIAHEHDAQCIVMGESRMYSGSPNPILEESRVYADALKEATGLPVYFEWEHTTSQEARKMQGKTETNDASAAALILQRYLDKQS